MNFNELVYSAGKVLDVIGVIIIFIGAFTALAIYLFRFIRKEEKKVSYTSTRQQVGRAILLGLEFLVAGDIIRTVASAPSFSNLGVLGLIILIRTFLSITLQVEVEHRWPWQKNTS